MKLHYETVSPLLLDCLQELMHHPVFDQFYLVGGTSLSLQRGHRLSVDIDLFTDTPYGQIDTASIHDALQELFPYTDRIEELQHIQMVYSMYVGKSWNECIKLDICYDESPIFPLLEVDGLRLASEKEIAAMKMQTITQPEQRRKDFWDIHDLLETYSLVEMKDWCLQRYPWTVTNADVKNAFMRMASISDCTEVNCLKGKYWEFIMEDLQEESKSSLL